MRKGRQTRANLLGPLKRDAPDTFFRLCHHCLYLNESDSEISQCSKCDKEFSLQQFEPHYGFLPTEAEFEEDEGFLDEPEDEIDERKMPQTKMSLNGLNVKW